jgi:hypothetical protein
LRRFRIDVQRKGYGALTWFSTLPGALEAGLSRTGLTNSFSRSWDDRAWISALWPSMARSHPNGTRVAGISRLGAPLAGARTGKPATRDYAEVGADWIDLLSNTACARCCTQRYATAYGFNAGSTAAVPGVRLCYFRVHGQTRRYGGHCPRRQSQIRLITRVGR